MRLKRASERHLAWLEVIGRIAGAASGVRPADRLPAPTLSRQQRLGAAAASIRGGILSA
jgi:hypothetical protein